MTGAETVFVAAITYRRPEMLRGLLDVFAKLDRPDADVRFLIVDNDPGASARGVVDAAMPAIGAERLLYVVEPEPGIPAARNRALREADRHGAALLCFTDDDTRPDRGWVRALLACQRRSGAALTFGPARYAPGADVRGAWRRFLLRSIAARGALLEREAARAAREGVVFTGATLNCMIDVGWARDHDVAFDVGMRDSGGSDSVFREAVRARGGTLAWCGDAVVHEQVPAERVNLRYQFRRARAHGMTFHRTGRRAHRLVLRHPLGRIAVGIGLMCVPVLGTASLMTGLHMFGMGIGILQARRGGSATLYARR